MSASFEKPGDRAPGMDDGARTVGLVGTVRHIATELRRSPLLLGYVTLGLASGVFGPPGTFVPTLVNYVLLGVYVLIIRLWTSGDSQHGRMRESTIPKRRDLLLVAVTFACAIAGTIWFWSNGLPTAILGSIRTRLQDSGWDRQLAGTVANAVVSTGLVIPAVLATFLAGLRPRHVGLRPHRIGLGLALVAIGILFAGVGNMTGTETTRLWAEPRAVPLALAVFAAQIFVNALPEEFVFRGVILSRLVPHMRNPRNALVLSSILFVLMHVPSLLRQHPEYSPWLFVLAPLVTPGPQPTGLVWGYLCYRTGSIWPGVLWHASAGTLGFLFW